MSEAGRSEAAAEGRGADPALPPQRPDPVALLIFLFLFCLLRVFFFPPPLRPPFFFFFFFFFFFSFFFSPFSSLVHKHSSKLNFIKSKKGQKTKNLTGTSLPQRQFNICLLVSVFSVLYMGKIKTPQKPFCKHSLQAFQTLLHKDLVTINIYK